MLDRPFGRRSLLRGAGALTAASGDSYCVTLTVNDHQALDDDRLTTIYAALVGQLARKSRDGSKL